MSYDTALTVFSPDGKLLQVDYAMEASKRGADTLGVVGKNCVVIGVEKKQVQSLQETRTIRKILRLDARTCLAFSGLNPDARVLASMARIECQSYSLNYDDEVPVDYIARYIAAVKQKYTTKGGARPFGVSALVGGFDANNIPRLYQTDPSGSFSEWRANAIGQNSKKILEHLEQSLKNKTPSELDVNQALQVACSALLEFAESSSGNVDAAGNLEFIVISLENNQIAYKTLSEEEIKTVIVNCQK